VFIKVEYGVTPSPERAVGTAAVYLAELNIVLFSLVLPPALSRINNEQKAQLSQTDCAMLHVIKHFSTSLKITQSHSK